MVDVENDAKCFIGEVETAFAEVAKVMEPAAAEVLERPKYVLSQLLFDLLYINGERPASAAIGVCLALELLAQALKLGRRLSTASNFNEEDLLIKDYYYAAAIEQVVPIGQPGVIGVLARAITGAAEERMTGSLDIHARLAAAAIEISLLMGNHRPDVDEQLRTALALCAKSTQDWSALPGGAVKDAVLNSLSVAAAKP